MHLYCHAFLGILLCSCMHGPYQKFGSITISVIRDTKKSKKINYITDIRTLLLMILEHFFCIIILYNSSETLFTNW